MEDVYREGCRVQEGASGWLMFEAVKAIKAIKAIKSYQAIKLSDSPESLYF